MSFYPFSKKVQPVGQRKHDNEPINASNLKPYRTKAQKVEAREAAIRWKGTFVSLTPRTVRPDHMKTA